MGIYSTKNISREEAIRLLEKIKRKEERSFDCFSDKELEDKLDRLSYSEQHEDILGFNNFLIIPKE